MEIKKLADSKITVYVLLILVTLCLVQLNILLSALIRIAGLVLASL
jgi:hypothetical protein